MMGNGLLAKMLNKVRENKFGLMVLYMKGGGKITNLMELED